MGGGNLQETEAMSRTVIYCLSKPKLRNQDHQTKNPAYPTVAPGRVSYNRVSKVFLYQKRRYKNVSKIYAVTGSLLNGGSAKKVLQHLLAVLFKVGPMGVLRRILTIDPEHVCNIEALLLSHSILGDLLACLVRKKVQSKGCAQPEQSWRIVILIIYCGLILLN